VNEKEHNFDDRPLTKARIDDLKASAAQLLREYETSEAQEKDKSALATA